MQKRTRTERLIRRRRGKRRAGNTAQRPSRTARVFAGNLRRICAARQISVVMLAKRMRRSPRTVQRVLAGEVEPRLRLMQALADRLGVGAVELLRGL